MSEINDEIKYESMNYYATKVIEAKTTLDILVNTDFLTDLMDIEINKKEVEKYGKKRKRKERLIGIRFK